MKNFICLDGTAYPLNKITHGHAIKQVRNLEGKLVDVVLPVIMLKGDHYAIDTFEPFTMGPPVEVQP